MKSILIYTIWSLIMLFPDGSRDEKPSAVLYVFEGSDWCTSCARLEKRILVDPSFMNQIDQLNIRIERIDFPQRKKIPAETKQYYDQVAEKFSFDGVFPSLFIIRPDNDKYRRIYFKNESADEMLLMIRDNLAVLYE
jgi:hypothetical protein